VKVERLAIFKNAKTGKHAGADARVMTMEQALAELSSEEERTVARATLLACATYRFSRILGGLRVSGRIVPEHVIARDMHQVEALTP